MIEGSDAARCRLHPKGWSAVVTPAAAEGHAHRRPKTVGAAPVTSSDQADLQFRILGPLEVVGGAGPLPLGGPKQKAVLACLLVQANEVVPVDALAEAIWEGRPLWRWPAAVQPLPRPVVTPRGL